jgi:hypothetical protein
MALNDIVTKPEHWYMVFWAIVGTIALTPIYALLYLIWRK